MVTEILLQGGWQLVAVRLGQQPFKENKKDGEKAIKGYHQDVADVCWGIC